MKWTRRKFLLCSSWVAGGAAAAGGLTWAACSKRWAARMLRERWREAFRPIAPPPVSPDPRAWSPHRVTVCWLGHATVLINFYGLHVLTDPSLGRRIGVDLRFGTLGPKRYVAPALRFEQLPPIDVLLLSHAHMDHLDLPTLRRFQTPPFTVTAAATRDLLAGTPLARAVELRWGEHTRWRHPLGELRIEACEVKHWGARWGRDTHRGYNGYLLEREGRKLLIAGDTAYTPRLGALRPRGPFDIAVMPIAAYRPWIRNHCTPEEAFDMADQAGARYLVPVHHQTFQLSDEPMHEPIERLQQAMAGEPERLALRRIGETFSLA
jgi:L-ascorbate metabolism protein UlaG (beta-lactamase superfamily)